MRYFKLIALLSLIFYQAVSQEASYPVINYKTKDYGKDFHPTNMAIVQDQRGIIYAANGFKLLEFDGSSWNSYPINKEAWILSLAVDSSGIIYAGSQNEFGLFAPDFNGKLKYRSLSDSLDLQDLDFTNVWRVHAFSGGVVFQSEEKMFIYSNGKLKVIDPETSFHTSFIVNDKLYVRQREKGLFEWKENTLVPINDNGIFKKPGIFLMAPFSGNKSILIGTREKGFYIFEPEGYSIRKFITDDELLRKALITGGTVTPDGLFAISTMQNGVILTDTSGKIIEIINKVHGLADDDVKQIICDRNNNLWTALNNGISRIEISSPLTLITEKSGLTGSINTIIRFRGLLYAGTNTGLFVNDPSDRLKYSFKAVHNLMVPVRSLTEAGGHLMAGTDAGIFEILNNDLLKIGKDVSFTLFYSPEMKILFSGGPKGMTAYRNEGSFKKISNLKIEGEDIIGITAEGSPAGEASEFWLGTRYNGAVRLKLNSDLSFTVENYNTADGMPEGPVMPAIFNSATVFETIRGLYGFTNENIVKEAVPDSLKDNKDFSKGYFSFLNNPGNTGKSVSFLIENDSKVWICADNSIEYLDKKNKMTIVSQPFSGIEAGKINFIYPESNGICWFGTAEGLIRYDGNTGKNYSKDYPSLIRKVTLVNNDSAIFMGTNFQSDRDHLEIINDQTVEFIPSVSYRNNSLRIDFSTSFYEYSDKILYSSMLEGNNPKWSQWSKDNYQVFTNLHEGSYKFRIKAINIYGKESTVSEYSFVILPPWYRSLPAYISYFIISLILLWLFARVYSYRLKKENIRLEGIVNERTVEVVRQKDEIVSKNIVLEHQKKEIEDSIRYASRIQTAVIPAESFCKSIIPESFVLFKPLNIVSGDFYWISRNGNKIIFTAADCTGHGVPGAFMSMLGVAFLNEIVNKDNITVPDIILKNLREKVIHALQQQGITGETRDGMDIAIVSIDTVENKLVFAGAYNPLIMIREEQLTEISGDKMPIGIYENMADFRKYEMDIRKGDVFYMYSDGFEDQFGGPEGKKFKAKRLKQLLMQIHKNPMPIQKEILEKTFEEWRGDLPQVDDVVVIGLTIESDLSD